MATLEVPTIPTWAKLVTDAILTGGRPHSIGWIDRHKKPSAWRYRIVCSNEMMEMDCRGSAETCYRKAAQLLGVEVPDVAQGSIEFGDGA